jgi:DNA repair protein RadA/Sms
MKTEFICQNCGARSAKWIGNCPSCGQWNTYTEEPVQRRSEPSVHRRKSIPSVQKITEIEVQQDSRITTGSPEFNRIIGGGVRKGSVILIGGEPGIGKSTLALQLVLQMPGIRSLYISGEESREQINYRARRLGNLHENCLVMNETFLEAILDQLDGIAPEIIIVDSIQTLYSEMVTSSAGSITQVRECAASLLIYAKEHNVPVILIGHINKEGNLAGPKVLEHIVDTVLQFEGDRNHFYRILRATKNRFGPTSEIGIFEMTGKGLKEIMNPSEILLSHFDEELSGIAIAACLEGIRPLLIEVQALVGHATYATPQRTSAAIDLRRLNMLLAVLEKRAGFNFSSKDVFVNIAGGLKVSDPASDLSVVVAVLSSLSDVVVSKQYCFTGEIGLSGEVRPVARIQQRIAEAERLGFTRMYLSKYNKKNIVGNNKIELSYLVKVDDIYNQIFRKSG